MSDNDGTKQDQLREAWIESLLQSATNPAGDSERLARAMQQIEEEANSLPVQNSPRKPRPSLRWGALTVAASVLLALFLFSQGNGTSGMAMAAVQRSLNVAAELMTRKYLLRVHYRTADDEVQIDKELFVRGHDHFVLRRPGLLPGTSLWLGKDGSEAWVVPPFGPVGKGTVTVLRRWLSSHEELDTPYLHVTTLLTRMSRGYRLETLADEPIVLPNGETEWCQHIRATRKATEEPNLPDTIELWTSRLSGMAIRVVPRWNLEDGESGRESVEVVFQGDEPSLAEDWFAAERHYEGKRMVLRIDSLGKPAWERPDSDS